MASSLVLAVGALRPPHLPQPGEGQRLAVGAVDEHRLLAFWPGTFFHSKNPSAGMMQRRLAKAPLVGALVGERLGPGVDHLVADLRVLGPERHQAPVEGVEAAHAAGLDDDVDVVGRRRRCSWARAPARRPPRRRSTWRARRAATPTRSGRTWAGSYRAASIVVRPRSRAVSGGGSGQAVPRHHTVATGRSSGIPELRGTQPADRRHGPAPAPAGAAGTRPAGRRRRHRGRTARPIARPRRRGRLRWPRPRRRRLTGRRACRGRGAGASTAPSRPAGGRAGGREHDPSPGVVGQAHEERRQVGHVVGDVPAHDDVPGRRW